MFLMLREIEVEYRVNGEDRIASTNLMSWPRTPDLNTLETPSLRLTLFQHPHLRQPKQHHRTLIPMPSVCHLPTSYHIILPWS